MRAPVSLINEAKFNAFGILCAGAVSDNSGTSYPRYFLGGTCQLTDNPTDVLTQMLSTCDGELALEPDGLSVSRAARRRSRR